MIYHDQNKEDDRMLMQLHRAEIEQSRQDNSYSHEIFERCSCIDPETGYDDFDPRDLEPPEEIYVSHDIVRCSCIENHNR